MALKGNLLYNGDFETGTTEEWETGAYGKPFDYTFSASPVAKYRGEYGGLLEAPVGLGEGYLSYDKVCSFEEYEGYLFIMYVKMVSGYVSMGALYGLDDKTNLIEPFFFGYNVEENVWRRYVALLRGFRDITHFKVGMYASYFGEQGKVYLDEVKLIPLQSVKSHTISDYRSFTNVTTSKTWYPTIACIGRCKLRSVVRVENVSGSSPTLDIQISVVLFDSLLSAYTFNHTQFTDEGKEEIAVDLPEVCYLIIDYNVGGSNPSFDIQHHLRIEPY